MIRGPDLNRPSERVYLVIPCYNEASRLNIQQFRAFLATNHATRLLFVDDGSSDNTIAVLEQLCCGYESRAQILRREKNSGKAEAVRVGILHALAQLQPEIIGFWDADLATPLESVDRLLAIFDQHPAIEMVFGARVKLLGRHVERRAVRHYLGRVFATIVSIALDLAIYDTQCGAKLFRVSDDLKHAFAEPFLSKWVFDVEILARYLKLYSHDTERLERAIYEYPLETWVDVAGSKVRPRDFFVAFWDIVRLRLRYFRRL